MSILSNGLNIFSYYHLVVSVIAVIITTFCSRSLCMKTNFSKIDLLLYQKIHLNQESNKFYKGIYRFSDFKLHEPLWLMINLFLFANFLLFKTNPLCKYLMQPLQSVNFLCETIADGSIYGAHTFITNYKGEPQSYVKNADFMLLTKLCDTSKYNAEETITKSVVEILYSSAFSKASKKSYAS